MDKGSPPCGGSHPTAPWVHYSSLLSTLAILPTRSCPVPNSTTRAGLSHSTLVDTWTFLSPHPPHTHKRSCGGAEEPHEEALGGCCRRLRMTFLHHAFFFLAAEVGGNDKNCLLLQNSHRGSVFWDTAVYTEIFYYQ